MIDGALAARALGSLVAIGGALLAVAFLVRWRLPFAAQRGRLVRVVETTPLPSASLHLVQVADRHLLLARSAMGVTLLWVVPRSAGEGPNP